VTSRRVEHVPTGRQLGIDVGLKAYVTDSEKEEPPAFMRGSVRSFAAKVVPVFPWKISLALGILSRAENSSNRAFLEL
jgi:hypothetical protein